MSPNIRSYNHLIDQISDNRHNKSPISNNIFSITKFENLMKSKKHSTYEKSISKLKGNQNFGRYNIKTNVRNSDIVNKRYINTLLFPYRYYLFSVFIKNNSILEKKNCFFSRKFMEVYKYFAKIVDIKTYLKLQKEFYIFKTEILDAQKLNTIERERKMNINDRLLIKHIRENDDINKI